MLIFWKVLAISKWFKDIFANLYIFYLKIKKSCRCKNLDIFPLTSSDYCSPGIQDHNFMWLSNYSMQVIHCDVWTFRVSMWGQFEFLILCTLILVPVHQLSNLKQFSQNIKDLFQENRTNTTLICSWMHFSHWFQIWQLSENLRNTTLDCCLDSELSFFLFIFHNHTLVSCVIWTVVLTSSSLLIRSIALGKALAEQIMLACILTL